MIYRPAPQEDTSSFLAQIVAHHSETNEKSIFWFLQFFIFWVIDDFVYNFQVYLTDPNFFWRVASQKMRIVLNRIFVLLSIFLWDS